MTPRVNVTAASIGRSLLIGGLFAWIVGAILTSVPSLAFLTALGGVLLAIGPILFWLGLAIIVIDWVLSHF